MPVRASMEGVKGVAWGSTLCPGIGSRLSRSQSAGDMARQTRPQALRIMKLIASGVTFSAAITRSPSFSRYWSSTSTSMRPWRISSSASSTVQSPSVASDMVSPLVFGDVLSGVGRGVKESAASSSWLSP